MVAGISKILGSSLAKGLAKNVGSAKAGGASGKAIGKKIAQSKTVENLRQGGIIEAQKAKEKLTKKKAFKEKLKQAKANKQKSFTFEGERFQTANY